MESGFKGGNFMEHKQIILGDYVFIPCKNAFNNKVSYWVSKKDCMIAIYAFTPTSKRDLDFHTTEDVLRSYINVFESKLNK